MWGIILHIGQVLKWIRRTRQVSQDEMAKAIKVSRSSIYRFENDGDFSIQNYLNYCKYLQIEAYLPLLICCNGSCKKMFKRLQKTNLDFEAFEMLVARIMIEGTVKETEMMIKMFDIN